MKTAENSWVESQFHHYFQTLAVSLLHKIDVGQVAYGPQVQLSENQVCASLYSPFWTQKRMLSDALILLHFSEGVVAAAAFTQLKHSLVGRKISAEGWIATQQSGIGLGRSTKALRDTFLQSLANQKNVCIEHETVDNNAVEVAKSKLSPTEQNIQRAKWLRLFGESKHTFAPQSINQAHNNSAQSTLFISQRALEQSLSPILAGQSKITRPRDCISRKQLRALLAANTHAKR